MLLEYRLSGSDSTELFHDRKEGGLDPGANSEFLFGQLQDHKQAFDFSDSKTSCTHPNY